MMINSVNIMHARKGGPLLAVCLLVTPIILASVWAHAQDIKGNQGQQYSSIRQQQQRPSASLSNNNQFKRPASNQLAVTGAPASSLYGYPSESLLGTGGAGVPSRQSSSAGYNSAPVQVPKQQKQLPAIDANNGNYDSPDYSSGPSGSQSSPASPDSGYTSNNNQDQQDSEADSEPALYGSVAGKPGVDFPAYTRIPKTSFTCEGKGYDFGYYADEETGCQAYHVCWSGRHESFLCGVGTVFNQAILACDYWHSVDCSKSSQFYSVNAELGKSSSEPASQQLQQPARSTPATSNGSQGSSTGNRQNNNNYNQTPARSSPVASSPAAIGTQQQQRYNSNNNNNNNNNIVSTSQDYPRSPVSASAGGIPISAGYGQTNNQASQQTYGRQPAKTNTNAGLRPVPLSRNNQQQQQYGARPQSVSAPTPLPFGQAQRSPAIYPQQQQQQQAQLQQFRQQQPRITGYSQQQQQIADKDDGSDGQEQQQQQALNNNFDDSPVQTTTIQSPILGNSLSANTQYNINPTNDLRRNNPATANYANNNQNPASSSAITTQYDTIINHSNNNQQLGQTFEQLEDQQQRQSEDGLKGARAAASNNRNWYIMRPVESH